MSDIKINIVGEFNKKGFVEADKATINLSNNFDKLRQSARRTFATILGYRALKESVKAFAANDAAIQNLTKSLDNLGFRFEAPGIVSYLESLEKTVAVSKDELFPAFRNLANATLDVAQAQKLLGTALDISAATGADLNSVTSALTRAYNGNFASLGKIQNAYTMAELKAMGFSESVRVLQEQFSGQAAAAADTYQAKITRLNIALGDAAEAIGQGIVDALETLGGGDYEKGLELIAEAGEKVGDAFRFAAKGVAYFQRFWKQGLFATNDQLAQFRRDMDGMFREDPARGRTALRERAKFLAVEQKQTEKIRKDREKASKLAEKEKKNQLQLTRAKAVFDLEKIQIEAALKGKITEEERTRLLLMKAILNEEGAVAEDLAKKLKQMQEDTQKLATMLTTFPKANDPFSDWLTTLDKLQAKLTSIMSITSAQNLSIRSSASAGNAAMAAGDYFAAQAQAGEASVDAANNIAAALAAIAGAKTPQELEAANEFLRAANETQAAADLLAESAAAMGLAAANAELLASVDVLGESIASMYRAGVNPNMITVNIAGNVTAEQDLIDAITEGLYTVQKRGQAITYNAVAI